MVGKRTVVVRPMGGKAKIVNVPSDGTVKDALDDAEVDYSGQIRIMADDTEVSLRTKIKDIEELVIVPSVKGGQ